MDIKKLGLQKLLDDGNVEKFLELSDLQERTKARQEFNELIKPFSMLGDVIAKHTKGVFVDEVLQDVAKVAQKVQDTLDNSLKDEVASLKQELTAMVSENDAATRQNAIARVEKLVADAERRIAKNVTDLATSELNRLLPQIQADARLSDEEIQQITDNAALSVESQMDSLISAYMADTKLNTDQVDGLKDFIQGLIPEVDFSKAVIDWRQIKNVPNLSGGGAGARTLYWLNDVDLSTTPPTDGQALVYNSTTKKWEPSDVDSLPTQTGNNGKFLTTDGTTASWATLAGGGDMAAATYDPTSVSGDAFLMTNMNGGNHKMFYTDGTGNVTELTHGASGKYLQSNGATSAPSWETVVATVSALDDVGDVTITTIASGEVLKWNGSAWINNTLAEAGIAAASHTHTASEVSDFSTAADARIAAANIDALNDVVITTVADNEVLAYNSGSGQWINQTAAEAGLAAASHTHTASEVSDFNTAADARISAAVGVSVQAYDANLPTWPSTVNATEVGYLDGVTSAIQTQLNAKAPTASPSFTGTVTLPTGLTGVLRADSGVVSTDSDVTDLVSAASDSAAGKVELATGAETTTGTDATRAVTPDGLAGSEFGKRSVSVLVSGSASGDSALATGDGLAAIPVDTTLNGMNLVAIKAYVTTVSSSGAPLFQVRRSRRTNATTRSTVDMLTTGVSIDANEFESADATTAAVIDTANDDVQTGDILLIDCDTAGTGTKGAQLLLTFQLA